MIVGKSEARAKRLAKRIGVPYKFRNTDPKYSTYRTVTYMERPLLVPNLEFWSMQLAKPFISKSREEMSKRWAAKDKQAQRWRNGSIRSVYDRVWHSENPADWSMELNRNGGFVVTCSGRSPVINGYWVLGVLNTTQYEDCVMTEVKAVKRLKSMDFNPAIETYYHFIGDGHELMTRSKDGLAKFRKQVKEKILWRLGNG